MAGESRVRLVPARDKASLLVRREPAMFKWRGVAGVRRPVSMVRIQASTSSRSETRPVK